MKGISGIIASAMLIAMTVAAGVLLYMYVNGYMQSATSSSNVVVTNAYYIKAVDRLTIDVKNIGLSTATINRIEIILSNNTSINTNISITIPPGGEKSISLNPNLSSTNTVPLYVVVVLDNGKYSEPTPVRVIG